MDRAPWWVVRGRTRRDREVICDACLARNVRIPQKSQIYADLDLRLDPAGDAAAPAAPRARAPAHRLEVDHRNVALERLTFIHVRI